MLPFEEIPDDLVPLTAHFKHLLTLATPEQPILLFLDSVDQLTGVQGNKLSWLPTRLPPNCKVNALRAIDLSLLLGEQLKNDFFFFTFEMMLSCAAEESNPIISRDYHLLRRIIDTEDCFIEVTALGEELAMDVIR